MRRAGTIRRLTASLCMIAMLASAVPAPAAAQAASFPSKPIRIVIPFGPGMVLADPVLPEPPGRPTQPVTNLTESKYTTTLYLQRDNTLAAQPPLRAGKYQYRQAFRPSQKVEDAVPIDDQFRDYVERGMRFAELVNAALAADVDA